MRIIVATLTVLAVATSGAAAPPPDWQPVDQAVGDLDPLTHSMRLIEPGLRTIGEQTSLFRVEADTPSGLTLHNSSYVRVGTGFRARFDRPDYLVIVSRRHFDRNIAPRFDGEFVELVPANTVYDLTPLPSDPAPPAHARYSVPGSQLDPRIDGRIDTRLSGRVYSSNGQVQSARLGPTSAEISSPRRGRIDIRRNLTPHPAGPATPSQSPRPAPKRDAVPPAPADGDEAAKRGGEGEKALKESGGQRE